MRTRITDRELLLAVIAFALVTVIGLPAIAQTYVPGGNPLLNTPTYDSAILAEPSATHYWEMNDKPSSCTGSYCTPGPCPSTMFDSIGAGATANPSPVPLVVTTPTASPFPYCAVPSPIKDNETFAELNNNNGQQGDAFLIPSGIIGTLCNGNAGGTCTHAFSIECIVVPDFATTNNGFFFGDDTTNSNFAMFFNLTSGGGSLVYEHAGSTTSINGTTGSFVPYDVVYSNNGSSGALYVNASNLLNALTVPTVAANVQSSFGLFGNSATFRGRIGKCSTYNTALTQIQVWTHYLTSALP
jgi:hypothetical protein